MDWAAIRAEYIAGGISLAALAEKHGASPGALRRHSRQEGWVAARAAARATPVSGGTEAVEASVSGKAAPGPADGGAEGEAKIARHTRRALLLMLKRAAEAIPSDATEIKTTGDGGETKLLKLRDLTAAYKELVGDLPADASDGGSRVIIDL